MFNFGYSEIGEEIFLKKFLGGLLLSGNCQEST
jgi:hypothetical protein